MPYLLGLLGAIVTVLVLLKRLADAGIDLGGLNPFARRRERAWKNKFEANPLFGLEDPMDAAAALAVGVAKASGDISSEQKSALLDAFRSTFDLDLVSAEQMLASSAYLVGDGQIFMDQVEGVVAKSMERFTDNQIASTLALIEEIAAVEGATERQRELIGRIRENFYNDNESTTWQ
ncbi:MAG: hypothetical protein OXI11_07165 [Gammaproteobacteria bacterium]|nr:hypothetical protein [Gammaproteobacteria bacterium]MXW46504.1 hypothetical protein [Gammaproteobacteria bacterium]MYD01580.1 hypothetical protein [Gammaproteobacteria bacterium]MYI26327.1 hypothetical protein [Gammaproteobacteria bacterium]